MAAQKGYFDIVDLLLNREEKADVNAEMTGKYSGVTPLHFAVLGHHTNIVKYLLGYGADVNAKATGIFEDFTPLHMTVNQGYDDIVTVLLEKGGINVNARDQMGSAPLHFAGKNGCTNIVKLLLENKADVNAATNEGISTLHIAAFGNHEGIIKLLLNHGADVNAKDKAGSTPLLFSLKCRHFKVADLLLADPNINIGCIKAASISKENKEGKEKFSQKLRQDYNLFQKVKEASNEKDKGKLDKLLKEIEELLESKTEYGFKPSLNYSPDGNDENTTIEIAIKAGGKLLQFLHDYAEKNIGINTEIFKKLKRAKENSQSKGDLCGVSVLKHSTPDQGFLFSNG